MITLMMIRVFAILAAVHGTNIPHDAMMSPTHVPTACEITMARLYDGSHDTALRLGVVIAHNPMSPRQCANYVAGYGYTTND